MCVWLRDGNLIVALMFERSLIPISVPFIIKNANPVPESSPGPPSTVSPFSSSTASNCMDISNQACVLMAKNKTDLCSDYYESHVLCPKYCNICHHDGSTTTTTVMTTTSAAETTTTTTASLTATNEQYPTTTAADNDTTTQYTKIPIITTTTTEPTYTTTTDYTKNPASTTTTATEPTYTTTTDYTKNPASTTTTTTTEPSYTTTTSYTKNPTTTTTTEPSYTTTTEYTKYPTTTTTTEPSYTITTEYTENPTTTTSLDSNFTAAAIFTSPRTTVRSQQVSCHVCLSEPDFCEEEYGTDTCELCMNAVTYYYGRITVIRSCGSAKDCKWQEQNDPRCINLDMLHSVGPHMEFECIFCCSSDNCNSGIIPR